VVFSMALTPASAELTQAAVLISILTAAILTLTLIVLPCSPLQWCSPWR
jgi:hypothetical protein